MEIRSAQAMPVGWKVPAAAGASTPTPTPAAPFTAPAAATPQQAPVDRDTVLLAQTATETPDEVRPPQQPLKTFREQASVHPLASAAGRYPLVGKMLEEVFGLDTAANALERPTNGIDLAA